MQITRGSKGIQDITHTYVGFLSCSQFPSSRTVSQLFQRYKLIWPGPVTPRGFRRCTSTSVKKFWRIWGGDLRHSPQIFGSSSYLLSVYCFPLTTYKPNIYNIKATSPTSNIVLTSFSAFIGKLTWSGGHPWPIDDPPWSFNGVRTSPVTLVMTCQRKPFPSVPPLPVTAAACRCRPVAIRCLREEREERGQKRQSWNFWKMVMMYSYSCLLIFGFFMQSIRGWKWTEENFSPVGIWVKDFTTSWMTTRTKWVVDIGNSLFRASRHINKLI